VKGGESVEVEVMGEADRVEEGRPTEKRGKSLRIGCFGCAVVGAGNVSNIEKSQETITSGTGDI
jgi:hypothetical protein